MLKRGCGVITINHKNFKTEICICCGFFFSRSELNLEVIIDVNIWQKIHKIVKCVNVADDWAGKWS